MRALSKQKFSYLLMSALGLWCPALSAPLPRRVNIMVGVTREESLGQIHLVAFVVAVRALLRWRPPRVAQYNRHEGRKRENREGICDG